MLIAAMHPSAAATTTCLKGVFLMSPMANTPGTLVSISSFTATPLFLIGALQAYPVLWLNLIAGLPVLAFTTYIFYTGVPIMMEIPPERGFLFSSAMLAFGLVTLVALLAITALLWGTPGIAPSFTT